MAVAESDAALAPKTVEVVRIQVRETTTQAWRRPGPERWLLIERHGEGQYKYYLSNAPMPHLGAKAADLGPSAVED